MPQKKKETMTAIQTFVNDFYLQYKITPSLREIAQGVGIGKTTAYRYLHTMHETGMLQYDGKEGVSTAFIEKVRFDSTMIAVLGRIACGAPTFAQEDVEMYVELPTALLGEGKFFFLRAKGDSMINADIYDGDLVLIRQQNTAEEGDIVVALLEDDATLKTYYRDEQRQCIRLHPENETYQDIYAKNVQIQGVAVKILKDIRRN